MKATIAKNNGDPQELISELLEIAARERECALKLDGESLSRLVEMKAAKLSVLKEKLPFIRENSLLFREQISRLQNINNANMRMFHSILKLTNGYRLLLKDSLLDTQTYGRSGSLEKPRMPLRLNCRA